jgi:hypothetical protein
VRGTPRVCGALHGRARDRRERVQHFPPDAACVRSTHTCRRAACHGTRCRHHDVDNHHLDNLNNNHQLDDLNNNYDGASVPPGASYHDNARVDKHDDVTTDDDHHAANYNNPTAPQSLIPASDSAVA